MIFAFYAALILIIVRATRLLVVDEWPPVRGLRYWFIRTFATVDQRGTVVSDPKRWGRLAGAAWSVAYIWTCPWCMSIWTGTGVWFIGAAWPWLVWPAAVVAAASMLAGWDANAQGEHEKRYEVMERKLLGHDDGR